MPEQVKFVVLDGTAHVLAGDEHTPCFLLVPPNAEWTTQQPYDLCGDCARLTGINTRAKGTETLAPMPETTAEPGEPVTEKPPKPKATNGKPKA